MASFSTSHSLFFLGISPKLNHSLFILQCYNYKQSLTSLRSRTQLMFHVLFLAPSLCHIHCHIQPVQYVAEFTIPTFRAARERGRGSFPLQRPPCRAGNRTPGWGHARGETAAGRPGSLGGCVFGLLGEQRLLERVVYFVGNLWG